MNLRPNDMDALQKKLKGSNQSGQLHQQCALASGEAAVYGHQSCHWWAAELTCSPSSPVWCLQHRPEQMLQ